MGVERPTARPAIIVSPGSDAAIRALLEGVPDPARDIEIAGAGLEEAFLTLTGNGAS